MAYRIIFILVFVAGLSACKAKDDSAAKPTETPSTEAKEPEVLESREEIVFDPRNPPAGFTVCHRNHCHRSEGGVASYQQVMDEIGATKIIGVPKLGPTPEAPADVAAPPTEATKTASGLAFKVLDQGNGGAKPAGESIVTVHYTGWTTDGKAFDSSVARGKPATFPLNRVSIRGWTEALSHMTVGARHRIWIPEELAYNGRPGAPAGMLVFDVELINLQ